ncbi:MAG TPA: hypothetical protein VFZ48_02450 [Candidatus Saccharimonadales bacterium]
MEQESETPLLYNTVKRVGHKLVLVAHAIFVALALAGTVVLLAILLASNMTSL